MADFSNRYRYNKDAGFSSVLFSGDTPVLEVELNEMQEIWREKIRMIFRNYLGDGLFNLGTMSYDNDTKIFVIQNEQAVVDGELIPITSLTINADEGQNIYLDVFEKDVDYTDTLKKYGNEQETVLVENEMFDPRVLEETTRRVVLAYTLSLTNATVGHKYLHLAQIVDGDYEVRANGLGGMVQRTGDSMQGILVAKSNTQYTTKQVRNIILSPVPPTISDGENGDIWFQYE